MGDGEHPGAPGRGVPLEAAEVACQVEEHLAEPILRLTRPLCPQVAEHRPGDVVVQGAPRPVTTESGRVDHPGERFGFHRLGRSSCRVAPSR